MYVLARHAPHLKWPTSILNVTVGSWRPWREPAKMVWFQNGIVLSWKWRACWTISKITRWLQQVYRNPVQAHRALNALSLNALSRYVSHGTKWVQYLISLAFFISFVVIQCNTNWPCLAILIIAGFAILLNIKGWLHPTGKSFIGLASMQQFSLMRGKYVFEV